MVVGEEKMGWGWSVSDLCLKFSFGYLIMFLVLVIDNCVYLSGERIMYFVVWR